MQRDCEIVVPRPHTPEYVEMIPHTMQCPLQRDRLPRVPTVGVASQCLASDLSSSGGSPRVGGGDRIRTDDRLVANQVLYQLSYAPLGGSRMRDRGFPVSRPGTSKARGGPEWWACVDLNHGPPAYQADALTN